MTETKEETDISSRRGMYIGEHGLDMSKGELRISGKELGYWLKQKRS